MSPSKRSPLIVGFGKSGRALAAYFTARGTPYFVYDRRAAELSRALDGDAALSARLAIQISDQFPPWESVSQILLSPGVPADLPELSHARGNGIEIIGEAEFAARQLTQPCIAITGTNGKTTVTHLVAHLLQSTGHAARPLGNVGTPLITAVTESYRGVVVLELSSFQLETLSTPFIDAAVILNITTDHLDRYSSFDGYAMAKLSIEKRLKRGGRLFVHSAVASQFGARLTNFELYNTENSSGNHHLENQEAALSLLRDFGLDEKRVEEGLRSFQRPPHRIEYVTTIGGVHFYDDSKGTNTDAVIKAVDSLPGPVILIAGGKGKGEDFTCWIAPFAKRVKSLFAIGECKWELERALSSHFPMEISSSLQEATKRAFEVATEGDYVLLSPGCASYDMFRDFEHRAEVFRLAVNELKA